MLHGIITLCAIAGRYAKYQHSPAFYVMPLSYVITLTGRGGQIGRALISHVGDRGFKSRSSQTNDL